MNTEIRQKIDKNTFALLAIALLAVVSMSSVFAQELETTEKYIVVMNDDDNSAKMVKDNQLRVSSTFSHIFNGFAANLTEEQVKSLESNPKIAYLQKDFPIVMDSQQIPTGVDRIDAETSNVAKIDGIDERVDADIAIIDTGVDKNHPDLNVVNFVNIAKRGSTDTDNNGHGSHVAGIAAALDNEIGVVGVAPGARIWAIKVFDDQNRAYLSDVLGGLDYVAANADKIDLVNMSLSCPNCGTIALLDDAITKLANLGIVVIVSAGNDGTDAKNTSPANSPDALAVSAIADSDGKPGSKGPKTSNGSDDTFAPFSNFGSAVKIAAPGVDIFSTEKNGGYGVKSGTSMASPHVAGTAALYIAKNSRDQNHDGKIDRTDVELLREELVVKSTRQTDPAGFSGDPDGIPEPLINANINTDERNLVFITNYFKHSVSVFDATTFEPIDMTKGDGVCLAPGAGILYPRGLTSNGNTLYVSSFGTNMIIRVDAQTCQLIDDVLKPFIRDPVHLAGPQGMSVQNDLLLIASTNNDKIVIYNANDGSFVKEINLESGSRPEDVKVNDGQIYASLGGKNTLVKLNQDDSVQTIVLPGNALAIPGDFVFDANKIYLTSTDNNLINEYDESGKYLQQWPFGGGFGTISIDKGPDSKLYVLSWLKSDVYSLDKSNGHTSEVINQDDSFKSSAILFHTATKVEKLPECIVEPSQQNVQSETPVTIIGKCTDSDGDNISFDWTQIAGPNVIPTITQIDGNTSQFSFVSPKSSEILQFELVGTANEKTSLPVIANVTVSYIPVPTVIVDPAEQNAKPGNLVTIKGIGISAKPIEKFIWKQIDGPKVPFDVVNGNTTSVLSFVAPNSSGSMIVFEFAIESNVQSSDSVQAKVNLEKSFNVGSFVTYVVKGERTTAGTFITMCDVGDKVLSGGIDGYPSYFFMGDSYPIGVGEQQEGWKISTFIGLRDRPSAQGIVLCLDLTP